MISGVLEFVKGSTCLIRNLLERDSLPHEEKLLEREL